MKQTFFEDILLLTFGLVVGLIIGHSVLKLESLNQSKVNVQSYKILSDKEIFAEYCAQSKPDEACNKLLQSIAPDQSPSEIYYNTGKTITNAVSTTAQLLDCLPVVGCSKATLIK